MRTGAQLVVAGLLARATITLAAPPPADEHKIELSTAGVLEASKPLMIGVKGGHRHATVFARVLSDAAIARLYRDAPARRRGAILPSLSTVRVMGRAAPASLDQPFGDDWVGAFDLRPLIGDARGLVMVEAGFEPNRARALYQVTDLGLLVVRSPIRSIVQVLRLSTGAPVAGATISTLDPRGRLTARGKTDAGGLLTFDATADQESLPPDPVLIARTGDGDQVIMLRPEQGRQDRGDVDDDALPARTLDLLRGETVEAALFTDRGAFQRGEKIQIAGWVAAASAVHADGLRLLPAGSAFRLTLTRDKKTLAETRVAVTAQGRLSGALAIPANAAVGNADVWMELPLARGRSHKLASRMVRIEAVRTSSPGTELRADRWELVRPEAARLTVVDPTRGGSETAKLSFRTTCEPIWRFHPAGLPDGWAVGDPAEAPTAIDGAVPPRGEDARAGRISLAISTEGAPPHATSLCRVRVTAPDRAGRDLTAETMLLVHPGPIYAGLRVVDRSPGGRGGPVQILVRTVSTAGEPVTAKGMTLELVRDSEGAMVPGSRRGLDLANGLAAAEIALPAPSEKGRAGFWAVARDAGGRLMTSAFVGAPVERDPDPVAMQAPAVVRPDDSVDILIRGRGGAKRGGGLLAILGGGVQRALSLPVTAGPVAMTFIAGQSLYPQVALEAAIAYPGRDEVASLDWVAGALRMPDAARALEIAVSAPRSVTAGEMITVRGAVRRVNGRAEPGVRAAITMVREAVLSRARYAELDSEIDFLRYRDDASAHWDMFEEIVEPYVVTDGWRLGDVEGGGSGGSSCPGMEPPPPAPEARWSDATAAFVPDAAADAQGTVAATFRAPATRGLYRIRVVASSPLPAGAPARFGSANAWIEVR